MKCSFHSCTRAGKVSMWGMVTHKYRVKVCWEHESVYRSYGWIRVRKPTGERREGCAVVRVKA